MRDKLPPEIESLCFQELNGQKIPLWPYIAAVTGHRSFAKPGEIDGLPGYERDTIKKAFRQELEQMARLWKKSCGEAQAPLILLAGMADGADQLAAEVALELPGELNVKVAAILPMDKELFRLTISDKERFDYLVEHAYLTYALPLPDNSPEYRARVADVDNPDTEPLRQIQYDKLGKFVALHSHVLFALWDGIDMTNLVGGTSTVLHFKLEGSTENQTRSDILTYTSVGPVMQFLLPRNNEENRREPIAKLENPEEIAVFYWSKHDLWDKNKKCYFFPSRVQMTEENRCKTSASRKREIVDTIQRVGDLNQQTIKHWKKLQTQEPESLKYLFECRDDAEDFCDAETEALMHHYAYTDKLAIMFKGGMKRIVEYYFWGVVLFLLSGSILSSFWEIRQNNWGQTTFFNFVHNGQNTCCDMFFSMPCPTILYWFSISLFVSGLFLARYMQNHVRFCRFRAVAEALRVQIFWRIAGIGDCVSGYYRTHQLPETDWLRSAINGLDVLLAAPADKNFVRSAEERQTFVRDVWINGQLSFFQKRLGDSEKTDSRPWMGVLQCAIGFLQILWFFQIIFFPFIPTWMESLHSCNALLAEIVQVLYGLVLVVIPIGGFWLVRKSINGPQSELDRYKQMLFPFDRAILLLNMKLKTRDSHTILRQLGTEAISENASWLLSVGERKLTLPR